MKIYRSIKTNICTQKFGANNIPLYKDWGMLGHNGMDWSAKDGEKIYFDVDIKGTVIEIKDDPNSGKGIKIVTRDGATDYKHIYWHLKSFAVEVGDEVETGQLIGYADNTGYSTGTHLHRGLKEVEYRNKKWRNLNTNNGYFGAIDPEPFMSNVFAPDLIKNLTLQISILKKMIEFIKRILDTKKR